MDGLFTVFLTQLATDCPVLLAYVIGLILGLALWRRFPRPCLLVGIAMAVAVSVSIIATFLYAYLPFAMDQFHWHHDQLDQMYTLVGLASSLGHAVAVAMMLTAVFVSRRPSTPPGPPDDHGTRVAVTDLDTRIQS